MGKVLKKITKPIQKLIPKEIKPFLPALAAVFGPAAFAGSMGGGQVRPWLLLSYQLGATGCYC
jgi:hypothetical protein